MTSTAFDSTPGANHECVATLPEPAAVALEDLVVLPARAHADDGPEM
ncbi:MAG TPA: hypothetical protein VFZ65_07035 [Planctomycetota bacterium]|nr:hypothetical protein [Planctomycetota bacterium]